MTTEKKAINGEIELNGIKYIPKSSVKLTDKAPSLKGLKLVLIRSYASGVHYGYLKSRKDLLAGLSVELINTRRVYKWAGACSLSQLSIDGSTDKASCQISVTVPEMEVMQVIEIIPVTAKAAENINSIAEWKK